MHCAHPLLGTVWLSAAFGVSLAIAPSDTVFAVASRTPDSPKVRQLSRRTIAEVGRTRVVAFRVQTPADVDRMPDSTVSDPNALEVVVDPMIAAGERMG